MSTVENLTNIVYKYSEKVRHFRQSFANLSFWLLHFNVVIILIVTKIVFQIKKEYSIPILIEYIILASLTLTCLISVLLAVPNGNNFFTYIKSMNFSFILLLIYSLVIKNFNSISTVDDSISTYLPRIHFYFQDIPFNWNSFSTYYNPIIIYPFGSDSFVYWQYFITHSFTNLYLSNSIFFVICGIMTLQYLMVEKRFSKYWTIVVVATIFLSPIIISWSKPVMQEGFTLFVILSFYYYFYSPTINLLSNKKRFFIITLLILEVLNLKPQYWIFLIPLTFELIKLARQRLFALSNKWKKEILLLLAVFVISIIFLPLMEIERFLNSYTEHVGDVPNNIPGVLRFIDTLYQLSIGSIVAFFPLSIEEWLVNNFGISIYSNIFDVGFVNFPIAFGVSIFILLFFPFIILTRRIMFHETLRFMVLMSPLVLLLSLRNFSLATPRYSLILLCLVLLTCYQLINDKRLNVNFHVTTILSLLLSLSLVLSLFFSTKFIVFDYPQSRISLKVDTSVSYSLRDFESSYISEFDGVSNLIRTSRDRKYCSKFILNTSQKFPISALIKFPKCDIIVVKDYLSKSEALKYRLDNFSIIKF